jgi:hypothetical protein
MDRQDLEPGNELLLTGPLTYTRGRDKLAFPV